MPTCLSVQRTRTDYGRSDGTRTGTQTFLVKFQGTDHTAKDAESADDGTSSIPAIGTRWEPGDPCKVIGRQATKSDRDQHHYDVTVSYSSKAEDERQTVENPLARPTQYSYEDGEEAEPYFRDTDDLPVTNSAGDDFQDLPQRAVSRGYVTVTRNVASYHDLTAESYRNTINSGAVTINGTTYAARTLRIAGYSASGPNIENDIEFWTETIRLAKNVEGWDDQYEDRGLNQLRNGKPEPILDAKHEPITLPYPLDGAGAARASITTPPEIITRKPYAAGGFPSFA